MLSKERAFLCNTSETACHGPRCNNELLITGASSPWLCQAPAPWSSPYYSHFAKEVTEPPGEVREQAQGHLPGVR